MKDFYNMFSAIRNSLGLINVVNTPTMIIVEGVPFSAIQKDISRIWSTSKINMNMFTIANNTKFAFFHFFAIEVVYMLEKLLIEKNLRTNKRTIKAIIDKLYKETWLNKLQDETTVIPDIIDFNKLNDLDLKPLESQLEFFRTYNRVIPRYNLKGMLLAGAAGSGKTFINLALFHALGMDKLVVFCPKNAVNRVWEENIKARFDGKKTYWLSTGNEPLVGGKDIYVFHYEQIERALDNIRLFTPYKMMVTLDESHFLNEVERQRTENYLEFVKRSGCLHVVPSSGTPIKALGKESIPLFRSIDPFFTKHVEKRFKDIYGANATKALDILNHRLGIVTFKILKEELKLDKPEFITIKIKTPDADKFTLDSISKDMTAFIQERVAYYNSQEKENVDKFFELINKAKRGISDRNTLASYDEYLDTAKHVRKFANVGQLQAIKEEIIFCNKFENSIILPQLVGEDKKTFRDVKSIYKYVILKIQGEALGRVVGKKRVECHMSMVPHIDFEQICNSTTKKTLVFTSYVEVLEKILDRLKEIGLTPSAVYGKTNANLSIIVKEYEKNIDINPLVATFNSLSTAVPLIMADTMIIINTPFRGYVLDQTVSRINRLGATTKATVYTTLLDTGDQPNISTRSHDILTWSQEQVEKITGVKSPYLISETADEVVIAAENYDLNFNLTLKAELLNLPIYSQW